MTACDRPLSEDGIYIQPISYPTVPRGLELRIRPWPIHRLAEVLADVRDRLEPKRQPRVLAAE